MRNAPKSHQNLPPSTLQIPPASDLVLQSMRNAPNLPFNLNCLEKVTTITPLPTPKKLTSFGPVWHTIFYNNNHVIYSGWHIWSEDQSSMWSIGTVPGRSSYTDTDESVVTPTRNRNHEEHCYHFLKSFGLTRDALRATVPTGLW